MISFPTEQRAKSMNGGVIIISALVCLTGVALFNWWANPYYMTGVRGGEKPAFFFHLGMAKPYHFLMREDKSVIVGSSRAGSGLDPSSPSLASDHYYNLAIPGARIRQIDRTLRSAVKSGGVDTLIVSLDLFGFNSYGDLDDDFAEAYERRMTLSPRPWFDYEFLLQGLGDFASSLLSFRALYDSVKTITYKTSSERSYFSLSEDGLWSPIFGSSRKPLKAFINSENSYLDNNWFPSSEPVFSLQPYEGFDPLQVYADMLDFAYSHDLSVKLVLLPVHGRMLETIFHAGLWDVFEQWKVLLVQLNEEVAERHMKEAYPLWDFLTYSELTTEPVGEDASRRKLLWMYDSSHVSSAGGEVILSIIVSDSDSSLGEKLSSDTVHDWLKDVRFRQQLFRQAWPNETEEIRYRVEKRKLKHNWQIVQRY